MRRLIRGLAVAALALTAMTACGDSSLSGQTIADIVTESVPVAYQSSLDAVACVPFDEPVEAASQTCTVALGPQQVNVAVTLRTPPAEAAAATDTGLAADTDWLVDVAWPSRLVAADQIAVMIANQFTADLGVDTSASCQHSVVALAEDESVICEAVDPAGVTRRFDVTLDSGGVVRLAIR